MGSPRRVTRLVFILAGAFACSGDSTGPEDTPCEAETSSVEATVSVEGSVVFDWTPSCAVALLLVEDGSSDMWFMSTPEDQWTSPEAGNRITPPVTYGQRPPGEWEWYGPEPLVEGRTYELILWRILPSGSTAECQSRFEDICLLTIETFVR